MLIETIKRYDPESKLIKFVSIDNLLLKGKSIPPQIKEVPCLITLPDRQMFIGKNVFDYLLLPGSGKLLAPPPFRNESNINESMNMNEPSSFVIGQKYSDGFATFNESEEDDKGFDDRTYTWTTLDSDVSINDSFTITAEETRKKSGTIDLDSYKIQRDLELKQNDLNNNTLPKPISSR